jgi:hypothetical protein
MQLAKPVYDAKRRILLAEGHAFHEYAQICAVANMYDHLITDDRLPPHEAQ